MQCKEHTACSVSVVHHRPLHTLRAFPAIKDDMEEEASLEARSADRQAQFPPGDLRHHLQARQIGLVNLTFHAPVLEFEVSVSHCVFRLEEGRASSTLEYACWNKGIGVVPRRRSFHARKGAGAVVGTVVEELLGSTSAQIVALRRVDMASPAGKSLMQRPSKAKVWRREVVVLSAEVREVWTARRCMPALVGHADS